MAMTTPMMASPCLPTSPFAFSTSLIAPLFPPPFRIRGRPLRIAASLSTSQQVQHSPASSKDAAWRDFAEHISGEWDGYGAEFSAEGTPLELPPSVVPEAFREWDVKVHDWQTQCPTLADQFLKYRVIRLLPTVGCEADAATQYSVDERQSEDTDSGVELLAFHVSGSYIAVWPGRRVLRERVGLGNPSKTYVYEGDKQSTLEVEHCLVQEGSPRFRVRTLQQIVMQEAQGNRMMIPTLKKITVLREKWESEFRNGESLGGCATSGSAFATATPLQVSELAGTWHVESFAAESGAYLVNAQKLLHKGSEISKREVSESLIPLPKGLWTELRLLEDGHFLMGAGWLVNADTAITSKCEFADNGKAKKTLLRFECRKS